MNVHELWGQDVSEGEWLFQRGYSGARDLEREDCGTNEYVIAV